MGKDVGERVLYAFNTSAILADNLIRIVIAFVTFPFVLATVGVDNYGLYVLVSAFSGYMGFFDLGFTQSVTKHVSSHTTGGRPLQATSTIATAHATLLIVGAASMLICFVLASFLPGLFSLTSTHETTLTTLIQFLGLTLLFGFAHNMLRATLSGMQRYDLVAGVGISDTLAKAVAVAVVIVTNGTVVDLVFFTLIGAQVAPIVAAILVSRIGVRLRLAPTSWNRAAFRETFTLGGSLTFMSFASLLIYQTDAIVLGALGSATALGLYAVAQKVNAVFRQLHGLFPTALISAASAYGEQAQWAKLRQAVLEGSFLSCLILAPAATVTAVLAEPLVLFWIGPSVSGASTMLQIYVIYFLTYSAENFPWIALVGLGRIRSLVPVVATTALLNVVLSLVLTVLYGPVGVVWATAISYMAMTPVFLRRALNELGISPRAFVRFVYLRVWPACGYAAVLTWTLIYLLPPAGLAWALAYGIAAYSSAVAIVMFAFVRREERTRIFQTIRGLYSRVTLRALAPPRA